MMRTPPTRRDGATMIELLVGIVVFSIIMTGLFAALRTAQDTILSGDRIAANAEDSAKVADRLRIDIEESNIAYVDTAFRGVYEGSNPWTYNHFYEGAAGLGQCSSRTCPWNTTLGQGGIEPKSPQAFVSTNYGFSGAGVQPTAIRAGRIWDDQDNLDQPGLCRLDDSWLQWGVELDAMMLFSPRTADGQFVTANSTAREAAKGLVASPDWQSIVFYYPVYDPAAGRMELHRQVLYLQDLVTGDVPETEYLDYYGGSSDGFDLWDGNDPAGVPSLLDLFDFGTDGTLDGVPDGSIPMTTNGVDSNYDEFGAWGWSSGGNEGNEFSGYIYRAKYLWNSPSGWSKSLSIYLERHTGRVSFYTDFWNSTTNEWWWRYAWLDREPTVVARDVLDLDFSTFVSNPQTPDNPTGVSNPRTVRATIVLSRRTVVDGRSRPIEHALTLEVQPRNR